MSIKMTWGLVSTSQGVRCSNSILYRRKLTEASFRRYYALRASVTFSYRSHDEWIIAQMLNARRRGWPVFGIANQIAVVFDSHGVPPGSFEGGLASGTDLSS